MTYFPDLSPCSYRGDVLDAIVSARGWHECEFCDASTVRPSEASNNLSMWPARYGIGTLSIPGRRAIYHAPTLIAHYIDEHGYRPPDDFITAVLECPPFRSADYFVALLKFAGDPFATALERELRKEWPDEYSLGDSARAALQRYRAPGARLQRWVNRLLRGSRETQRLTMAGGS